MRARLYLKTRLALKNDVICNTSYGLLLRGKFEREY